MVKLSLPYAPSSPDCVRTVPSAIGNPTNLIESVKSAYEAAAAVRGAVPVGVCSEGVIEGIVLQIEGLIRSKSIGASPGVVSPTSHTCPATVGDVYEVYAVRLALDIPDGVVVGHSKHI